MIPDAEQVSGTYLDLVLGLWARDEDTEALVQGEQRLTRKQARSRLFRLGQALRGQGLRPGDSVGLFLANRVDSVLVQLAVHLIGCRVVFLPPEPGARELAGLVGQSGARVVVADPVFARQAAAAAERCDSAPALLSLGPCEQQHTDDLSAIASRCQDLRPEGVPVPGPDEAVTVIYTGGTLGRPKLAAHSRLLYDAMAASAAAGTGTSADAGMTSSPRENGRVLATTLVSHGSGHLTVLYALLSGATLVVLPEWDADAALTVLREERITVTAMVPPMLYSLLDHPDCRPGALPLLQGISVGGAPTSPARLRQAVGVFGPVISQGYGQSEALGITALPAQDLPTADDSPLWRSCGRPLPGTQLEIRDVHGGSALPEGEVGEVCVRSPAVMLGYYRDPERTAGTLQEGWLRTGDLGHRDTGGNLYLVDRVKDVIITGRRSGNVYSRVLEDFLLTLPGVRNAAAVGVPDEEYGESVRVFLAVTEDAVVDPRTVGAAVAAELGALYTPRETVLLPELPVTQVGKVDKQALRAMPAGAPVPD